MNLPPILKGDSLTRLMQGAACGAALAMIIGFSWGGWTLQSKAVQLADQKAEAAVVAALTPICVDKFEQAADAKTALAALKAEDTWKRDSFISKGGWATFPGNASNRDVAEACAKVLGEAK
jgi:alpha/beta superfamily hydrolase